MQGIAEGGTKVGRSGWDDVGGLLETRRALQEVSNLLIMAAYHSSITH